MSQPQDEHIEDSGSSTDQHITGSPETGSFTTDEAPRSDTPAYGSSNVGVNEANEDQPAR